MKSHPHYNIDKYLMRDFVRDIVVPITDGTGLSYALLRNRQSPLKAEIMVSVSCHLDKAHYLTSSTDHLHVFLPNRTFYCHVFWLFSLGPSLFIQHAWDESIQQFVEAIERSKEKGPFWVCACSIYQNNNPAKGVTIGQQLGTDPEYGPFATVLKEVDLMLAVLTDGCDIYTRLWYVHG